MAIAYLISTGLNLSDAENLIKKVRPFIKITPSQRKVLKQLEDEYQQKSSSKIT